MMTELIINKPMTRSCADNIHVECQGYSLFRSINENGVMDEYNYKVKCECACHGKSS